MSAYRLVARSAGGLAAGAVVAFAGPPGGLVVGAITAALCAAGRPALIRSGLLIAVGALMLAPAVALPAGPFLLVAAELSFDASHSRHATVERVLVAKRVRELLLVLGGALAISGACFALAGATARRPAMVAAGALSVGALVVLLARLGR